MITECENPPDPTVYIFQREWLDCPTKTTLSKKAVLVKMGEINEKYYNKVIEVDPITIKDLRL